MNNALINNKYLKILLILIGMLFPVLYSLLFSNDFNFMKLFIIICLIEFIVLNMIINIRELWEFIYKKRYLIGIIIFCFLVFFGFHGSSIDEYNKYIEPNSVIENGNPMFGKTRPIRSDEWMTQTPNILSQNSNLNNYNIINKTMMGTEKNITFYPKLPSHSLSILSAPQLIGYLFLPLNQAFSFSWFFDLFVLFFSTFEFFMIITQKNKIWSLAGAVLITFAPAVQWWEIVEILPPIILAIDLFYYYINTKKLLFKIILPIIIGICGAAYFQVLYPAWMVPYFYFGIVMVIWFLYKCKNKYKWYDIIFLVIIVLATMFVIIYPEYNSSKEIYEKVRNTVYPGSRFSTGGYGWKLLYNYVIDLFLPFINFSNASEASQFLSFYPIPFILSIKFIYDNIKKHKNDLLLILLTLLGILFSIWNYIKIPSFLAKISLLYLSTPERLQVVVGFISLILLIYCLSNYTHIEPKNNYLYLIISMLFSYMAIFIVKSNYPEITSIKLIIASFILFSLLNYMIFINNKNKIYLPLSLIIISFISGISIHPLCQGLNVFYDKPVSKQIKEISNQDKDALWITADSPIILSNYILANGVKVLNSTNYYPNDNLWSVLDKNNNYKNIWNRYSHISINLSKEATNVVLIQSDSININLYANDLCLLDVSYIASTSPQLENFSNNSIKIKDIYKNDNVFIYKTTCY
jgi:hypothetical protein